MKTISINDCKIVGVFGKLNVVCFLQEGRINIAVGKFFNDDIEIIEAAGIYPCKAGTLKSGLEEEFGVTITSQEVSELVLHFL